MRLATRCASIVRSSSWSTHRRATSPSSVAWRSSSAPAAIDIDVTRFLADLSVRHCPAFDEWVDAKRLELRRIVCPGAQRSSARPVLAASVARRARACGKMERARSACRRTDGGARRGTLPRPATATARWPTYSRFVTRLATDAGRAPGRSLAEVAARVENALDRAPRARPATESWYAHAPSFNARLVGRNAEWDTLVRAWKSVSHEASRVVLIEGEPGVGKSRLADDFLRWVTSQGGVALRGRGYDARAGAPFGAVIEALHSALDAPGRSGRGSGMARSRSRACCRNYGSASPVSPTRRRRAPRPTGGGCSSPWRNCFSPSPRRIQSSC